MLPTHVAQAHSAQCYQEWTVTQNTDPASNRFITDFWKLVLSSINSLYRVDNSAKDQESKCSYLHSSNIKPSVRVSIIQLFTTSFQKATFRTCHKASFVLSHWLWIISGQLQTGKFFIKQEVEHAEHIYPIPSPQINKFKLNVKDKQNLLYKQTADLNPPYFVCQVLYSNKLCNRIRLFWQPFDHAELDTDSLWRNTMLHWTL